MQNILNQTDIQNIKNFQPNTYNNYSRNVIKQDELLNKIKDSHNNILSKEMNLRNQQEDIKNLGNLNKYNNDMVKLAYQNRKQALQDFKEGRLGNEDPFMNFMKDPTIFPDQSINKDKPSGVDDLEALERLSQPLLKAHSPASLPNLNSAMLIENNNNLSHDHANNSIDEPIHNNPELASSLIKPTNVPRNSQASGLLKKNSIISPHLKNTQAQNPYSTFPHNNPANNPFNYNNNAPYSPYNYPNFQQPIVNVIPIPMPQNEKKSSSHSSSRGHSNKIPEEVRTMLTKQNELLQNFIEKVEKNGTLETKEDYSEKYEQKIRELEKNFDLSQELLNLRKQLYSFNEKSSKEEKKPCKRIKIIINYLFYFM